MTDRELTSFCGLWCGDCIPSNERLYTLTAELRALLAQTDFKNYAALKSTKIAAFQDYEVFLSVLNAFEKLQCYDGCRKGPRSAAGCAKDCEIRACAREKGLEGCWDCDACPTCGIIKKMEKSHPDIKRNLAMIQKHGIEHWKDYRGRHYSRSEPLIF